MLRVDPSVTQADTPLPPPNITNKTTQRPHVRLKRLDERADFICVHMPICKLLLINYVLPNYCRTVPKTLPNRIGREKDGLPSSRND